MKDHANYPLREWSRWEASDMDGARQGERTGSERINRRPDTLVAQRVSCELDHTKYPRREWSRWEASDIDLGPQG